MKCRIHICKDCYELAIVQKSITVLTPGLSQLKAEGTVSSSKFFVSNDISEDDTDESLGADRCLDCCWYSFEYAFN